MMMEGKCAKALEMIGSFGEGTVLPNGFYDFGLSTDSTTGVHVPRQFNRRQRQHKCSCTTYLRHYVIRGGRFQKICLAPNSLYLFIGQDYLKCKHLNWPYERLVLEYILYRVCRFQQIITKPIAMHEHAIWQQQGTVELRYLLKLADIFRKCQFRNPENSNI